MKKLDEIRLNDKVLLILKARRRFPIPPNLHNSLPLEEGIYVGKVVGRPIISADKTLFLQIEFGNGVAVCDSLSYLIATASWDSKIQIFHVERA